MAVVLIFFVSGSVVSILRALFPISPPRPPPGGSTGGLRSSIGARPRCSRNGSGTWSPTVWGGIINYAVYALLVSSFGVFARYPFLAVAVGSGRGPRNEFRDVVPLRLSVGHAMTMRRRRAVAATRVENRIRLIFWCRRCDPLGGAVSGAQLRRQRRSDAPRQSPGPRASRGGFRVRRAGPHQFAPARPGWVFTRPTTA